MEKRFCPSCNEVSHHTVLDFYNKPINGKNNAKCLKCGKVYQIVPNKVEDSIDVSTTVRRAYKAPKDTNIVQFVSRSQSNNRGSP